jgi:hypothetical protein
MEEDSSLALIEQGRDMAYDNLASLVFSYLKELHQDYKDGIIDIMYLKGATESLQILFNRLTGSSLELDSNG